MSKERPFFREHLLGSSCQRIWIKNYKRRFVPSRTEQEAKTFQSLICVIRGFNSYLVFRMSYFAIHHFVSLRGEN
jgi:hypothetical protein